ncbi:DegV family protein [Chloroflexota bacterium]
MSKVGIVTDSVNCLPANLTKEYGIHIVPLLLSINGKSYRDQVDITNDEFWKLFPEIKEFTTSAPAPGDFASTFEELSKSTDSIACITLSRALSATHEAAAQAGEMFKSEHPDINIEVIDSRTAAGAQGFIVLEAARAAQSGKNLAEVTQVARDMIPRVKFVVGMETLKYLIRSGRAPKVAYMVELAQVKPIIGMVNNTGAVENLTRARGKRKCMLRMVDMVKEHVDISKPVHLMAHYTDRIEDAEEVRNMATSQYNSAEVYVTPFTPVMSGHTGPVVTLSFYS